MNAEGEPQPNPLAQSAVGATADTSASDVSLATGATSLEAYGVPILVHPSGAGKVTYHDGEYIAIPNPGYVFQSWYWEFGDFDAQIVGAVLAERRTRLDDTAQHAGNVDDEIIKTYADASMYLVALFELTGFDNPVETNDTSGHKWGSPTYEWNEDYSICKAISKCSHCDLKDKVKSKRVEKKETDATCTEGGSITYTAIFRKKKLNTSITVETPVLGHDWGDWTPDAAQSVETRACARCGEIETRPLVTPAPEATPTPTPTPTPTATPHVHTPAEAVRENEVAATCAAKGSYDSVVYCAVCRAELSRETVETEALGHTGAEAVRENEAPATCAAKGSHDNVVYCAVCKAEISRETVETKALGHTGGTATCLAKAVCERCGEAYGEFGAHDYVSTDEHWEDKETVDGKQYSTWGHCEACSVCEHVKKVEDGRQEIQEVIGLND